MGQEEEKPQSTGQEEERAETVTSSPPLGTPDEQMANPFADALSSEERAQLETYLRKEGLLHPQEPHHSQAEEAGRRDTSAARLSAAGVSPADEGDVLLRRERL